jgi:hypothetical protein
MVPEKGILAILFHQVAIPLELAIQIQRRQGAALEVDK